jgi:23S rRNA pseudouridine1911/1915/1917 synthase
MLPKEFAKWRGITLPSPSTDCPPELFGVVFEDADLLVLNKPAGLVCHPTKTDEYSSLVGRIRLYLNASAMGATGDALQEAAAGESHNRGLASAAMNLSWHLVNRLDRETSGLVLVAKNDLAAREIRRIWENRAVEKVYLAIVHGWPGSDSGTVDTPLGKDVRSKVAIKDCVRPDGAAALTRYTVRQRFEHPAAGRLSLLDVRPETGRKHQIRIHLAHAGHPILGDKLYGKDEGCYLAFVESRLAPEQRKLLVLENHALHARAVRFQWRHRDWRFEAEPERAFRSMLA